MFKNKVFLIGVIFMLSGCSTAMLGMIGAQITPQKEEKKECVSTPEKPCLSKIAVQGGQF